MWVLPRQGGLNYLGTCTVYTYIHVAFTFPAYRLYIHVYLYTPFFRYGIYIHCIECVVCGVSEYGIIGMCGWQCHETLELYLAS